MVVEEMEEEGKMMEQGQGVLREEDGVVGNDEEETEVEEAAAAASDAADEVHELTNGLKQKKIL